MQNMKFFAPVHSPFHFEYIFRTLRKIDIDEEKTYELKLIFNISPWNRTIVLVIFNLIIDHGINNVDSLQTSSCKFWPAEHKANSGHSPRYFCISRWDEISTMLRTKFFSIIFSLSKFENGSRTWSQDEGAEIRADITRTGCLPCWCLLN